VPKKESYGNVQMRNKTSDAASSTACFYTMGADVNCTAQRRRRTDITGCNNEKSQEWWDPWHHRDGKTVHSGGRSCAWYDPPLPYNRVRKLICHRGVGEKHANKNVKDGWQVRKCEAGKGLVEEIEKRKAELQATRRKRQVVR